MIRRLAIAVLVFLWVTGGDGSVGNARGCLVCSSVGCNVNRAQAGTGYQTWKLEGSTETGVQASVFREFDTDDLKDFCWGYVYHINVATSAVLESRQFSGLVSLETATVDSGNAISSYCFADCPRLTHVNCRQSPTTIPKGAFQNCPMLQALYCDPPSYVDDDAFDGCVMFSPDWGSSLYSVGDYAFRGCGFKKFGLFKSNIISVGDGAFSGCLEMTSFAMKQYLGRIPNDFFKDCVQLRSVSWPLAPTSVGDGAFSGCSSFANSSFFESVTSFGAYALSGSALMTLERKQQGIDTLEEGVFSDCTELTSCVFKLSTTDIPNELFRGCVKLENVAWPLDGTQTITSVGSYAFYGCSLLNLSSLFESVTTVGDYAFSGCSLMTFGPKRAILLGAGVFRDCVELTLCRLESSSQNIPADLFRGCVKLENVSWPLESSQSITSVGSYAFSGCYLLNPILDFAASVSIGDYAFMGSALGEFNLTKLSVLGKGAFRDCWNLTIVVFPNDWQFDGAIPAELFSGCDRLEEVQNLPEVVSVVEFSAFAGCRLINETTFPYSRYVTIEDSGFAGCGLTVVDFSEVYKLYLGESAFRGCVDLRDIKLPDSLSHLSSFVFAGCNALTTVTIPSQVSSFGLGCFEDCASLKTVTYLGSAVPSGAIFNGCHSLEKVTLSDSHNGCWFGGFQAKPCSFIERSLGGFIGIMIVVIALVVAGILAFLGCTGQLKCSKNGGEGQEAPNQ